MTANCGPVLGDVDYTISPDDYSMPVEDFLNKNFGVGTWVLDPVDDKYVVFDVGHTGPGRSYIVIDRGLRRHSAMIPASRIN